MTGQRDPNPQRRHFGAPARLALARMAVETHPDSAGAHYAVAAELFRIEENDEAILAFREGLKRGRPDPDRLARFTHALTMRGDGAEAITVLAAAREHHPRHALLLTRTGEALLALGRWDEAVAMLRDALTSDPSNVDGAQALRSALESRGDWQGLIDLADRQDRLDALTMPIMLAKIAGLIGADRAAEAAALLDPDVFVSVEDLAAPIGFPDIAAFNAALLAEIESPDNVRLSDVPRLALAGGTQIEDLEVGDRPAMMALRAAIEQAISRYLTSRRAEAAVLCRIARPAGKLTTWALILGADDAQDEHFHLYSSVAGVYYVAMPDGCDPAIDHAGCLVIPCRSRAVARDLVPPRHIAPSPGRLVLFPGYFPHRTMPTGAAGKRVSVAFDVVT